MFGLGMTEVIIIAVVIGFLCFKFFRRTNIQKISSHDEEILSKQGETSILKTSLSSRFKTSKSGVIEDSKLGLQWAPSDGQRMNHYEAEKYARSLNLDGGGWRLPTRAELKSLYDTSFKRHIEPSFNIERKRNAASMCIWVWTSELSGPSGAWGFEFTTGSEGSSYRDIFGSGLEDTDARFFYDTLRVLVVRSRR